MDISKKIYEAERRLKTQHPPKSQEDLSEIEMLAQLEVLGGKAYNAKAYFEAKERQKREQEAENNTQSEDDKKC